ncbi:MAG: DNA translocase FtsK 4TM domain-containing protein [Chloroflexi bacterium]|nr:DNA translocase FtsK 4TM domain-containing protein [Chloroflexota bacterium]
MAQKQAKPEPQPKSTGTKRQANAQTRASAAQPPATRGGTKATRPTTPPSQTPTPPPKNKGKAKTTPANPTPRKFSLPKVQLPRLEFNPRRQAIVLGMALIFFSLLVNLSALSSNQGRLMGNLIDLIWGLFGWGSSPILIGLMLTGLWLIGWGMSRPWSLPPLRVVGGLGLTAVLLALTSQIAYLADNGLNSFDAIVAARAGGGLMGNLLAESLVRTAGQGGTLFILLVVGLASGALATGISWAEIRELFTRPEPAPATQAPLPIETYRPPAETGAPTAALATTPAPAGDVVLPWVEPPAPNGTAAPLPPIAPEPEGEAEPEGLLKRLGGGRRRAKPPAEGSPLPLILGRDEKQGHLWTLPSLEEMLNKGSDYVENHDYMRQQANTIEETLRSFGAPAKIVDTLPGPTLIQYCVEPLYIELRNGKQTKVKVGKIASLADDLALALSARSVRVEAPVPGKGYVGIEVPNEQKALVSLRDVMESEAFQKIAKKSPLAIGLGQDVSGHAVAVDMTKMPHMLVAGATGSGKSVCVNTIIACLLLQNSPEDLQLVMVDPKRVELTGYNGIPHLAAPVVVEMERVVGTLQWALREMDNRYRAFAETGARNLVDYNSKLLKKGERKLPYIVIIIDELADLMMLAPEDTERGITRLAQMARATGIHMILATQRPSVDVVTGLIKANFPARIAFAVASSTDSRVVLDTTGAERLLGAGDMLFQDPNAPAPLRMQGCFVSDAELNQLIDYWKHARRFGHVERETNFIRANTDVVSKAELDQAVWDVDEDLARMIKTAETAPIIAPAPPPIPAAPSKLAQAPAPPPRWVPPTRPTVVMEGVVEVAKAAEIEPKLEEEAESEEAEETVAEPVVETVAAVNVEEYTADPLYPEVLAFVEKHGSASTSMIQRHFRIGYTRAARLLEAVSAKS